MLFWRVQTKSVPCTREIQRWTMQDKELVLFYIHFPPLTFSEALLALVYCCERRGNFNTFYLADNLPLCLQHSPSHSEFNSKHRPPTTSPKLTFLLDSSVAIKSVSKTSVSSPRYCLALTRGLRCQSQCCSLREKYPPSDWWGVHKPVMSRSLTHSWCLIIRISVLSEQARLPGNKRT